MSYISVVVPAYNEEKLIGNCLSNIRDQNYNKDFELIVIDNNSTDKTAATAKKLGAKVIKELQQGYVFSIKRGFENAKGDIVAFTDADTTVDKNWLRSIENAFKDKKTVAITGGSIIASEKVFETFLSISYNIFLYITFFLNLPNLSGFNFAIRRKDLESLGGINTEFTMSPDVEIGMRLKKIGKVRFVPEMKAKTNYRRFNHSFPSVIKDYSKGYIYAVILRKPPPIIQEVIR